MDLFVSYSHEDTKAVDAIITSLQQLGVSIWIDRSALETGQAFAERIVGAIERSRAVLLFLSPASISSRAVLQEIQIAWELKRIILPIWLSDIELPASIRFYLAGLQFLDISRLEEAEVLAALSEALRSHGISIGPQAGEHRRPRKMDERSPQAPTKPPSRRSQAHPGDEIRYATVLCCQSDVSRSSDESFEVDDWYNIVVAAQRTCLDIVGRFGGHVTQCDGNRLVACFGYPIAHEDDAERAARAALAIIDSADGNAQTSLQAAPATSFRIGLHSGAVVVATVSSEGPQVVQIVGHAISLAQHLQEIAEPGSAVISAATLRLIQQIFITHSLQDQHFRGSSQTFAAYRLVRERAVRSPVDENSDWRSTPLVGREHELNLLLDRLAQAREGTGSVLLLQAEAGMGKTRLLHAFRERLIEEPHTWFECRCSSLREMSAFHPLIDLFVQGLEVDPEGSGDQRLRAVEKALLPTGIPLTETVPTIARLLSIPLDDRYAVEALSPEAERHRIFDSLISWLFSVSVDQPVVFAIEDLQWIDPSTSEVIDRLIQECATGRIFVILSARSDADLPWAFRTSVANLSLNRLTRSQTASLVKGLAQRPLSEEVVARIVQRSDGVPLFAEEITRSFLESHLEADAAGLTPEQPAEGAIPAALRSPLMARVDRLGAAKDLLQLASVLGREFSHAMLAAVWNGSPECLSDGLTALLKAEMIYRRGSRHFANYTFKHALIQESVYRSLTKERRRDIHAKIADTRVTQFPELAETEPDWIARHYEEAGLVDQAVKYYHLANERAMRTSAHLEGIHHLRRAITFVSQSPDERGRLRHELTLQNDLAARLMACKGYAHRETEVAFDRIRSLCSQAVDDTDIRVRSLSSLAAFHQVRADLDVACRYGEDLLTIAQDTHNEHYSLWGHLAIGLPLFWSGRAREAVHHLLRASTLRDQANADFRDLTQDPGVLARSHASLALWLLGEPKRAFEMSDSAIALAQTLDHPFSLAAAWAFSALVRQWGREVSPARLAAQKTIELATAQFFPLWEGIGRIARGWADTVLGHAVDGLADMQNGLNQLSTTGTVVGRPHVMTLFADLERQRGNLDQAMRILHEARELSEQKGLRFWDAEIYRVWGEVCMQEPTPRFEEAEVRLREGLSIANAQGAKSLGSRISISLARLLQKQGRTTEARELIEPLAPSGESPDATDAAQLLNMLQ